MAFAVAALRLTPLAPAPALRRDQTRPHRIESHLALSYSPSRLAVGSALRPRRRRGFSHSSASLGQEEAEKPSSAPDDSPTDGEEPGSQPDASSFDGASAEDMECIREVQRVLELLKKNRDMTFGEVKLTIMIEDPRDVERKRLLGIEDIDEVTRDDLVDALVDVNEGRTPQDRVALRLLAKEMSEWPDLEVEAPKSKRKLSKSSPYAKATDIGIDLETAAKRLNIDWDAAAEIDGDEDEEEIDVPPVVGYGALYLVTALPVLIGISVVLILFYNSLQ